MKPRMSSARWSTLFAVMSGLLLFATQAARAQEPDPAKSEAARAFASIKWTEGPAKVNIGTLAQIEVPAGHRFADPTGTRKMMELMQNPTDGSELGLLTDNDLNWFVLFEFSDIGYVKDAEKEKLDPDGMLSSIKEGNEQGNEARKERGWAPISIVGWHTPPFYNPQTHNLEWCIKGESEGHTIVNYNTRILGRGGVMSANLLVDPQELDKTLPKVKKVLTAFSFVEGKRYAEWRSGDKVAAYGLSALVVGGAVGVAAKMGFLAKILASLGKLWKLVIVGIVALGASIKKLFTGRRSTQAVREAPPQDTPPQT